MKSNLSCNVVQDLLPQYAEKLLSPETEREIRAHLAECPACSRMYAEMTSPEPELLTAEAEVDYLKKIRSSRLRLLLCGLLALAAVTVGALFLIQYLQSQADAQLAAEAQKNSELLEQIAQNAVHYDEASKTLVIYGNHPQDKTVLPPELEEAEYLDAQFDSFHLSLYLPHLRSENPDLEQALPAYLDRTEQSLAFLRSYLAEHCADQYPASLAAKYVDLTVHRTEEYRWEQMEDRVKLELGSFFWHREELYLLSLLGSKTVQWKQLGYAWYLSCCVDPYSEVLARTDPEDLKQASYWDYYLRLGGSEDMTPENFRKLTDAVACACLVKGMKWGTAYESWPLKDTAIYSALRSQRQLGDEMSVCMAGSFIAWLRDRYGFDRVSSFCFDQTDFEEAFSTDYESAYSAWTDWIRQSCGVEKAS